MSDRGPSIGPPTTSKGRWMPGTSLNAPIRVRRGAAAAGARLDHPYLAAAPCTRLIEEVE